MCIFLAGWLAGWQSKYSGLKSFLKKYSYFHAQYILTFNNELIRNVSSKNAAKKCCSCGQAGSTETFWIYFGSFVCAFEMSKFNKNENCKAEVRKPKVHEVYEKVHEVYQVHKVAKFTKVQEVHKVQEA